MSGDSDGRWTRGPAPLTGRRDVYVRAMSQGMNNADACRAAGVNRKTGQRWRLGRIAIDPTTGARYVYEPIMVRAVVVSPRFLSATERLTIADSHRAGHSARWIATRLGRSASTISRELQRNSDPATGEYRPHAAQQRMLVRRARPKLRKLESNIELRGMVQARLKKRWSPEQIANSLRIEFPDRAEFHLTAETIYQAIYTVSKVLTREHGPVLRTGRIHRRRRRTTIRSRRFVEPMVMIEERPDDVDDRATPGDWEGDLIVGKLNGSAIGTLVERSTRFTMLVHFVGQHTAEQLRDSMTQMFNALPAHLRRSLTWDQGIEMARHHEFAAATGMRVYFCHRASPWQRGTNENTNGLLREYFPKGTDLSVHSPEDLQRVADELNNRPRKTLGWASPADLLAKLIVTAV